ncbi:MAG: hypothetical protein EZS28_030193, partial [Streblomastix strix]
MNQAQALKDLIENGTSIEYFDRGYIMQVKDKIKVYEERKKSAKTLTLAQQTRLLFEARDGGKSKQKRGQQRTPHEEEYDMDDEIQQNDRKYQQESVQARQYQYEEQLKDDLEDDEQLIVEKPFKIPRPASMNQVKKQPQINYTSSQVDLEELIRLKIKQILSDDPESVVSPNQQQFNPN